MTGKRARKNSAKDRKIRQNMRLAKAEEAKKQEASRNGPHSTPEFIEEEVFDFEGYYYSSEYREAIASAEREYDSRHARFWPNFGAWR